ncbi:Gfo/Idh/MocA family protein [Streptomyces sp. NPDC059894]|uniref:Gfo/Idh/MocA family protein n=1 Tax=unclassified Streptomyces TaxID=2593676 RepID=UPI00365364CC
MTALRTAVVGLGWAGRSIWLPRLAAHPAFEVTAVVDPDPAARAAVVRELPGCTAYTRPDGLDAGAIDLAVVAVPNHAHADVAAGLLRRGVHVFVEKPVCLSTREADELAAAQRAKGATLVAGSAARHRRDVGALRELVDRVGTLRHVEVSWIRARGVPGTGWFVRRDASGGGAMVDLGWHLLDVALPLLGTATVDQVAGSVAADFVNRSASRAAWKADPSASPAAEGDVEDTVRAFLVTDGGVSVALHAAWASHAPLDRTEITVSGSAGTATLRCTFGFSPDRAAPSLTLVSDGELSTVALPEEPVGAEYDRQVDALPAMLADGDPDAAVAEARRIIDVVERVYASARRRAPSAAREPAWAATTG